MKKIVYAIYGENPNITKVYLDKKEFAETLSKEEKTDKLHRKTCQKFRYNSEFDFYEPSEIFSSLLLK